MNQVSHLNSQPTPCMFSLLNKPLGANFNWKTFDNFAFGKNYSLIGFSDRLLLINQLSYIGAVDNLLVFVPFPRIAAQK